MNWAKELPRDKNNIPYDSAPPAFVSNQAQMGVPVASSVITFSDKTTVVQIGVLGGQSANSAVLYKWGTGSVTSSNFDGFVISGDTRKLVIPVSVTGINSVAGANVANGLYPAMAVKTATAISASVLTVEW